jgi:hypothetical protein
MTPAWPGFEMNIAIPDEIADKLAIGDAAAKVEVAFETYRLDHAQSVDTRPSKFVLPGVGRCEWSNWRSRGILSSAESCVAPLRLPPLWVTEIDSNGDACPLGNGVPPVPPGHFALDVEFGTSGAPVEFDPDPIRTFRLAASPWVPAIPDSRLSNQNREASFCRGTRFTVRTGRAADTFRASFDLGDIGIQKPSTKKNGDGDADE